METSLEIAALCLTAITLGTGHTWSVSTTRCHSSPWERLGDGPYRGPSPSPFGAGWGMFSALLRLERL